MDAAFFTVHSGLPREAPGDEESLAWALACAGTPQDARILDAGCGPGADLKTFSRLRPQATLTGIELHAPFVERVRAEQPGVRCVLGDMTTPPGGPYELIWSAGAAYGPGVRAALTAWATQLAPGGRVAFSDCLWRGERRSVAARDFWARDYPSMGDVNTHHATVEAAGYRVLDARWLSDAAWDAYYGPLAARVRALRADADEALAAVLDATDAEINLWRQHGDEYGYYLTVAERAG